MSARRRDKRAARLGSGVTLAMLHFYRDVVLEPGLVVTRTVRLRDGVRITGRVPAGSPAQPVIVGGSSLWWSR